MHMQAHMRARDALLLRRPGCRGSAYRNWRNSVRTTQHRSRGTREAGTSAAALRPLPLPPLLWLLLLLLLLWLWWARLGSPQKETRRLRLRRWPMPTRARSCRRPHGSRAPRAPHQAGSPPAAGLPLWSAVHTDPMVTCRAQAQRPRGRAPCAQRRLRPPARQAQVHVRALAAVPTRPHVRSQ
jgi:hypothetical protein